MSDLFDIDFNEEDEFVRIKQLMLDSIQLFKN